MGPVAPPAGFAGDLTPLESTLFGANEVNAGGRFHPFGANGAQYRRGGKVD